MSAPVTALEIDGRAVTGPSMLAGVLLGTQQSWALVLTAEWASDLCDRIRREGMLKDAAVRVTVAAGSLQGRAWFEFEGEAEAGVVRVVAIGLAELLPESHG